MGKVVEMAEWRKVETDVGVWTCTCNCQTFFLYESGEVECANCNETTSILCSPITDDAG